MKKIWWITGAFVLVVLSSFIVVEFKKPDSIIKKVAGVAVDLPRPDTNALIKPPEKSTSYYEPTIYSKAAILVDVPSAYVLYEKNADMKVPIASTTKIMTAMVVLDNHPGSLDDVVTITPQMINVEGSDIQLRSGEKITVSNLLKGLLIMSGNDAAYSLALHFGGKDSFVKEMNDKAAFLDLSDTHYQCPAGLNDDGYSSARDLAFLASYALKNPIFSQIVSTREVTVTSTDGNLIHDLKNSNRLLQIDDPSYFSYAVGVKTGFTNAAGHCLVSSAKENGHQLIGVILNTNASTITASAIESKKLLTWGFADWTWPN